MLSSGGGGYAEAAYLALTGVAICTGGIGALIGGNIPEITTYQISKEEWQFQSIP